MDNKSYNIRVPKRWARIALIVGATALIVAPLTAVASHVFDDVPGSHTFHNDITWLEQSGVTKGCNPPDNTEFCPDDNVTRGQMAAFMNRFAGYIGAEDGIPAQADHATTANSADNADTVDGQHADDLLTRAVTAQTEDEGGPPLVAFPAYTPVSTVDIEAPSEGAIVVQFSLSAEADGGEASYRVGISPGDNCSDLDPNTHVYGSVSDTVEYDTSSGSATFTVGSGTHSFTLCGQTGGLNADVFASSLTALLVGDGTTLPVIASQGAGSGGGFGD